MGKARIGVDERIYRWFGPRDWICLRWNEVKRTEGMGLVCMMCFLIPPWSVGLDLTGWKDRIWCGSILWFAGIGGEGPGKSLEVCFWYRQ